jgi:hypothetical protein
MCGRLFYTSYQKGNEMSNQNSVLLDEISAVLKYEPCQRHSYFQLKYFLIGKEPTNQSKMWQCLRELKSRKESLESLDLEYEDSKDKLELLDITLERIRMKLESVQDELSKREIQIQTNQTNRQRASLEANILQLVERKNWIEEESRFFLETFKSILKTEPLKNFDDLDSQKEYWEEKLANKLNLKMLTSNQLDMEMVETIVALPDDMPIKKQILNTLNLRHVSLMKQLQETASQIEIKKE